jgi:hypothetical protein
MYSGRRDPWKICMRTNLSWKSRARNQYVAILVFSPEVLVSQNQAVQTFLLYIVYVNGRVHFT